MKLELTVFERMLILESLPAEGRRDLHKLVDDIISQVAFDEAEMEALDIPVTGTFEWTPELAAKSVELGVKTIDLGAKAWEIVFTPFKEAEETGTEVAGAPAAAARRGRGGAL